MLGFLDLEEERRGRVLATVVAGRRGGHSVHHCMLYTVQVYMYLYIQCTCMHSPGTHHRICYIILTGLCSSLLHVHVYLKPIQFAGVTKVWICTASGGQPQAVPAVSKAHQHQPEITQMQEEKLNELKEDLQHKCEIPPPTHPNCM